ncbi:MAG: 2-dehydropantoate 2-reductase [Candidatus Hydrogenedentes bacterium]|nr:2-dehydropantoate 2-reductase [Candidatus Hydrogenedentota bacterium]
MRILVMGAGAMGSVVGGFMAKAGHEVTLVGRDPHMAAIARDGLRITGIWGEHHVRELVALTDTQGLVAGAFDLILITVKAYNTAEAARAIAPLAGPDTLVCSYQNGLGNAEAIAAEVGWERTIGVRAIYGVVVRQPGLVEVTVIANPTAVGAYHEATPVSRVQEIAAGMDAAGLPTVYTDRIRTVLWGKVAYNCALNPLSALLDVPYGALLDTEHTREILRDIVFELYATGQAMGIELEPASPEAYVRLLFEKLIPPTAAHYASMRADLQHRRRTEIDAMNGAIVRYAGRYGVPCPVNTLLTRLVHAREHALGVRVPE